MNNSEGSNDSIGVKDSLDVFTKECGEFVIFGLNTDVDLHVIFVYLEFHDNIF